MTTKMKAPTGTRGEALIEGHSYKIPKDGVITVAQDTHIPTLRRHGFVDHFEEAEDIAAQIDAMTDADELVEFIEERAGEADNGMSLKKLRRLAKEAVAG
jgi:mRNA-degrading endonuclease toxin of MazEF toxin-antitoxin module